MSKLSGKQEWESYKQAVEFNLLSRLYRTLLRRVR